MNISSFMNYLETGENPIIGYFSIDEVSMETRYYFPDKKSMKKLNGYCVEIRPRETSGKGIPHFHVFNTEEKNGFTTCVKIQEPDYFLHGKYKDKFNGKEIDALIRFLRSTHNGKSMWDFLKATWSSMHPDNRIPDDLQMPDYTKLPRRKERRIINGIY